MIELDGDVDDRAEAASFARYTHRFSHRPWAERVEIGDLTARLDRPRKAAARRPDRALETGVSRAARSRRGAGDGEARRARVQVNQPVEEGSPCASDEKPESRLRRKN
ncbi:hypothetical protein [Sorangium sp. So ce233]|uniref:hypothetical protein n=1 Tax=Sorangium sp. So ce233 TaxID=3133290 RepID=UPI003F62BECD